MQSAKTKKETIKALFDDELIILKSREYKDAIDAHAAAMNKGRDFQEAHKDMDIEQASEEEKQEMYSIIADVHIKEARVIQAKLELDRSKMPINIAEINKSWEAKHGEEI